MRLSIGPTQAAIMAAAGTENKPIIAWDNRAVDAIMTTQIGTDTPGYPPSNAATGSTYDEWIGTPSVDEVALRAELPGNELCTFVAIAAHNAAEIGAGVVAQRTGTSRTNEIARSQDFSTGWTAFGTTITANSLIAPDGTTSAAALKEDASTGTHSCGNNTTVAFTSGTAYTVSIHVKRTAGTRHFGIALPSAPFGAFVTAAFNLTTGVATVDSPGTSTTAGMVDIGNGWWRCWIKSTATATSSVNTIRYAISNSSTVGWTSYTGSTSTGVYIWGAQVEAGSLTSYIYTTTAAAASSWHDIGQWVIPTDGSALGWYFSGAVVTFWRVLFHNVSPSVKPSVGVFFVGNPMTMPRQFYQGYSPILTPTQVDMQSNISAGGHLLGSSVVKRGSRIAMEFNNTSDTFFRDVEWIGFQKHFNEGGGSFVAWRPTKYPDDLHYFWRDGDTLQPTNSGPKALMSVAVQGRVYEG